MTFQKVNIGVVGAGGFTELWYLPILITHPNVCVKAICSKGGTNARKLAEKFSIPSSYSSYMEMLDSEALDGVCIVTPNQSHYEIAEEIMNRSIHVMCEKPLAMDSLEAMKMFSLAKKKKIITGINFTYRENPGVIKLKELIESGVCGKIYEGQFQYKGAYGLAGPPGWRGTKSQGGSGGVLADLGSHLIDLVHYILDEKVSDVQATAANLQSGDLKQLNEMKNDQAPDSVYFLAGFPSGITGLFYTSWIVSQGNRNQTIELTFTGSKGAIHFLASELGIRLRYASGDDSWEDIELENVYNWNDHGEPEEKKFRPWRLTQKNEIWKWVERITDVKEGLPTNQNDYPDFKDGYHVQKVIDAVIQSAVLEKKVKIKFEIHKEEN